MVITVQVTRRKSNSSSLLLGIKTVTCYLRITCCHGRKLFQVHTSQPQVSGSCSRKQPHHGHPVPSLSWRVFPCLRTTKEQEAKWPPESAFSALLLCVFHPVREWSVGFPLFSSFLHGQMDMRSLISSIFRFYLRWGRNFLRHPLRRRRATFQAVHKSITKASV